MKLKNQVCSLELAKKLKELGLKRDSCFIYKYHTTIKYLHPHSSAEKMEISRTIDSTAIVVENYGPIIYPDIAAYTAAELLEMLPLQITISNTEFILAMHSNSEDNQIRINYFKEMSFSLDAELFPIDVEAFNLSDALARLLVFLIVNDYIKVEDLNNGKTT